MSATRAIFMANVNKNNINEECEGMSIIISNYINISYIQM